MTKCDEETKLEKTVSNDTILENNETSKHPLQKCLEKEKEKIKNNNR